MAMRGTQILAFVAFAAGLASAAATRRWPIYYSRVSTRLGPENVQYRINQDWASEHRMADSTTYGLNFPGESDYAVFYCQNLCDRTAGCKAMFTSFNNSKPAAPRSWATCTLFNAALEPTLYVPDDDPEYPAVGGYNKFGSPIS